jgi:hypothetical protein
MSWSDWCDVKGLQAIAKHTGLCAAAIVSFIVVHWLVLWGLGPGLLSTLVESLERFLIAALFLVFVIKIGYDFIREIWRNVRDKNIVLA